MCMKLVKSVLTLTLMLFCLQCVSFAEDTVPDDIKKPDVSPSVQEAINKDSELLKKLMLQSQQRLPDPEVKDVEFEVGDNPIEGSDSAKLIMVQFSDYSCGHCAMYTKETYPEILKNYIDTGKLRYVVIDYPLPENLPAVRASEAAHCASEQDKYWKMHEEIYLEQESLIDINSMASFINLDIDKFNACMESGKYESVVNENISLGTKLKIPSVPNFIIAKIDPVNPKKVKGIAYIRGAKPYTYFQQEIDKALTDIN